MLTVAVEETADVERSATLDELVAEGARRMLAAALEAESTSTSRRWPTSVTTGVIAWSCATATPRPDRW